MTPSALLSLIASIANREVLKIGQMSQVDPGVLPPEHMEALLKLSKIARTAMDAEEDDGGGKAIRVTDEETADAIKLLSGQ